MHMSLFQYVFLQLLTVDKCYGQRVQPYMEWWRSMGILAVIVSMSHVIAFIICIPIQVMYQYYLFEMIKCSILSFC